MGLSSPVSILIFDGRRRTLYVANPPIPTTPRTRSVTRRTTSVSDMSLYSTCDSSSSVLLAVVVVSLASVVV